MHMHAYTHIHTCTHKHTHTHLVHVELGKGEVSRNVVRFGLEGFTIPVLRLVIPVQFQV